MKPASIAIFTLVGLITVGCPAFLYKVGPNSNAPVVATPEPTDYKVSVKLALSYSYTNVDVGLYDPNDSGTTLEALQREKSEIPDKGRDFTIIETDAHVLRNGIIKVMLPAGAYPNRDYVANFFFNTPPPPKPGKQLVVTILKGAEAPVLMCGGKRLKLEYFTRM